MNNITELPGRGDLPENPITLEPRRLGYCDHASIMLDEHTRTVRCADPNCAAVLDPFNFLCSNAHALQRAWGAYREVMHKANEIAERVTDLKREEQRLRAQIRRHQDKGGVINVRECKP